MTNETFLERSARRAKMTDLERNIELINQAWDNGFYFAFLPDPEFATVAELQKSYPIHLGWNNKYLTGSMITDSMGYIVKLK